MSERPVICNQTWIEPELEEKLESAGTLVTLSEQAPRPELLAALADAEAYLGWDRADAEFFDAGPSLRVVSLPAVGYDNVDVALATRHGVAVCHTPGVLNAAVADLTMTMILMLARRIPAFRAYAEGGGWAAGDPEPPLGHDVAGRTLGVIGFGRIGREVTRRMQALGMRTIWHDRFDRAPADAPESEFRALDDLLRESDCVSVHTNLDESSRHLLGERELGLMRETAYLVNTARGPIVDQPALAAALHAGAIAGAALDVLEDEPPDADDPIFGAPNVIILPHIGTSTEETRRAMRELAVENLLAVLEGRPPPACVNPEALSGP